jgi:hypothetical protein
MFCSYIWLLAVGVLEAHGHTDQLQSQHHLTASEIQVACSSSAAV